ncbi:hypothetical protein [Streptomyces sp. BBFR102]|uniref:hypothetical protein n=1 Tax=Streptomyces sp. BBFR102 TaxID=3448171 RepID=UPI003F52A10E
MRWKPEVLRELSGIRESLGTALGVAQRSEKSLHELARSHEKAAGQWKEELERVQDGLEDLREKTRQGVRLQVEANADLHGIREEVAELSAVVPLLRALAERGGAAEPDGASRAGEVGAVHGADGPDASAHGGNEQHPAADGTSRGDDMEDLNGDARSPQPHHDDLKAAIWAAYRGDEPKNAAPSSPPSGPGRAEHAGLTSEGEHGLLLLRAAGLASAELVAHRDTWEWFADLAVRHQHFRHPSQVEEIEDGRIRTSLSGRSLVAALIGLWERIGQAPVNTVDWAMAAAYYQRAAQRLVNLTSEGGIIRIVLDDGADDAAED